MENLKYILEPNKNDSKPKSFWKKMKMPSSFAIIISIIAFLVLLTWILKWSGVTADVKETINGVETVTKQNIKAMGILDIFYAILGSFASKANLILFILVIGAFVSITFKTKALEAGIGRLIKKMNGKEIWLIPIIMLFFSAGGTSFGMAEETIPFYLILMPVFIAAGFDAMTGFLVIMLGAGIGTVGSILNPFKIPIAVEAINSAEGTKILSESTGIAFRVIGYVLLTAMAISFVTWYAWKVKKDQKRSVVYDIRDTWASFKMEGEVELTKKRKATLWVFISSFFLLIFCLLAWHTFGANAFLTLQDKIAEYFPYFETQFSPIGDFGYVEMSLLFLFALIIIYFINRKELLEQGGFFNLFFKGASELLSVGGIIVVAAGIQFILAKSYMQNLIVGGLNSALGGLHPTLFIFLTYIMFVMISFLIPSSSGFATAIFPIFGPTAVQVGMASGAITAFTYSSGLINIISPTSGIFSAASSIGKIPYNKYLKATWPLMIGIVALSLTILLIGSALPTSLGLF